MADSLAQHLHDLVQQRRFEQVHEICEQHQLFQLTAEKAKNLFRTVENVLLAFYLAGYAHAALQHWDLAMLYFQYTIIVVPAISASAFALESQKKFILCSLIRHGRLESHPTGLVPKCLQRAFQHHLSLYNELAHLYSAVVASSLPSISQPTGGSKDRRLTLQRFIEQNRAALQQDFHYGLVKQAIRQLPRHIIRSTLPKVYCSLPMVDVVKLTNLPSAAAARNLLNEMIQSREISATLENGPNGERSILNFADDSSPQSALDEQKAIKNSVTNTAALVEQLRQLDQRIGESVRYKKNLTSGKVALAIDAEDMMAEMMAEHSGISSGDNNSIGMMFD